MHCVRARMSGAEPERKPKGEPIRVEPRQTRDQVRARAKPRKPGCPQARAIKANRAGLSLPETEAEPGPEPNRVGPSRNLDGALSTLHEPRQDKRRRPEMNQTR